jgi:hypothetical protein
LFVKIVEKFQQKKEQGVGIGFIRFRGLLLFGAVGLQMFFYYPTYPIAKFG